MRYEGSRLIYSPSDLIRYLASPFSSWMDRYRLENPGAVVPDQATEDQKLIAQTGNEHEQDTLVEFRASTPGLVEIGGVGAEEAERQTIAAILAKVPVIYQARLSDDRFAGAADFLILDGFGRYQVWDAKLARSPKPYFAIQLCCYSEMFAASTNEPLPTKFGIILGTGDRVPLNFEDFIHYYRRVRRDFLALQDGFSGNLDDRPEPLPRADHGLWTSYADEFFDSRDHLLRVAEITVGQIKKLKAAGISTVCELAASSGRSVPKLAANTLETLVGQARLQSQTRADRLTNPEAPARYEVLTDDGDHGVRGLAALPPEHRADVFFDMEGYPLVDGGLEYLFGACCFAQDGESLAFLDWWAHDRSEEKVAFERFVDWVFQRWLENQGMHIYHYAAYEVSALRRLSTHHDTRQDKVDDLLRHKVFVDLYQIVCHGLRIGEDSYSIKKVERLYRGGRSTEVATAADSIVQYARWMGSGQSRGWRGSSILREIREYNRDDCVSTAELARWLRSVAAEKGIESALSASASESAVELKALSPEVVSRLALAATLRERGDAVSLVLGDLIEFHRREDKPRWWKMYERDQATAQELRDDPCCVEGISAVGGPRISKQSLIQAYRFDASQECKLRADDETSVMFCGALDTKFTLVDIDYQSGQLELKLSRKALLEKCGGAFPTSGSILPDEIISKKPIPGALAAVAEKQLQGRLNAPATALLNRVAPVLALQTPDESVVEAAVRISASMSGGCLVIQGPPGTGKTYTAARMIRGLLAAGKRVGVVSNSHKAVLHLLEDCGRALREVGASLTGIKVGGEGEGPLFNENPAFLHVEKGADAKDAHSTGVVGGTAWLFCRPEWEGELDFLFVDEAGQVSLANTVAVTRCTRNLVLLGDQMQLEQPIQGTHPGDSGLSGLQYALKDLETSRVDAPLFHAVVPTQSGLFLGESRRMHPSVCRFISESIYDGRLHSHSDCARQRVFPSSGLAGFVTAEHGIVFMGVEHDGNSQQSDEEVERVRLIYNDLVGRSYTASDGSTKSLSLEHFLFIAPYNAQVRALQLVFPRDARIGSVDRFQGQEAPVCILSLCSSYGEYGSRGLSFILDRNRINVAISRAQCLAVVVADPRIAGAAAGSLSEMNLVNLFCKLSGSDRTRISTCGSSQTETSGGNP
jgi:predicted RecB family nuclease